MQRTPCERFSLPFSFFVLQFSILHFCYSFLVVGALRMRPTPFSNFSGPDAAPPRGTRTADPPPSLPVWVPREREGGHGENLGS